MNKIFEKLFGETANGIANIVDRFVQTNRRLNSLEDKVYKK